MNQKGNEKEKVLSHREIDRRKKTYKKPTVGTEVLCLIKEEHGRQEDMKVRSFFGLMSNIAKLWLIRYRSYLWSMVMVETIHEDSTP